MIKKTITAIIVILLISTCLFSINIGANNLSVAKAKTIYVDDDADSGWYDDMHVHTIQEGVDAANSGDTVIIPSFLFNSWYGEVYKNL